MKKTNFRLKNVTIFAPHTVGITYTDDSVITVDLKPLIESLAVFAPLKNPSEFATATVH